MEAIKGVNVVHLLVGSPFRGAQLQVLIQFLHTCGLQYDENIQFSVLLMEDDRVAATGSLDGSTLKCIAVSPDFQGDDLTSQVMTALMQEAFRRGMRHLMLYTKPQNQYIFQSFGFHPLMRTASCLVMENRRDGLEQFIAALPPCQASAPPVGCIVAHCNPFTLGHRYLIETAARECSHVHVFILSEDKGLFSPGERLEMARLGCQDLPNVSVHPSGPYMISAATFPTYFLKNPAQAQDVYCEVDIRLFAEKIAPLLHIQRRYVGTEPLSPVTARYHAELHRLLPAYGIEVREIPRLKAQDQEISASRVRAQLQHGMPSALRTLLPESSLNLIRQKQGETPCPIPTECRKT